MLDKPGTPGREPVIVNGKELAIGAHLTVALSQTRSLDLQVGVPLNWSQNEFNEVLDRIVQAANRQRAIQDLEATKALLLNAEQDIYNYTKQRVEKESEFAIAHAVSNKRGDFVIREGSGQEKALKALDTNVDNARIRVAGLKKLIEELEEKCR